MLWTGFKGLGLQGGLSSANAVRKGPMWHRLPEASSTLIGSTHVLDDGPWLMQVRIPYPIYPIQRERQIPHYLQNEQDHLPQLPITCRILTALQNLGWPCNDLSEPATLSLQQYLAANLSMHLSVLYYVVDCGISGDASEEPWGINHKFLCSPCKYPLFL